MVSRVQLDLERAEVDGQTGAAAAQLEPARALVERDVELPRKLAAEAEQPLRRADRRSPWGGLRALERLGAPAGRHVVGGEARETGELAPAALAGGVRDERVDVIGEELERLPSRRTPRPGRAAA